MTTAVSTTRSRGLVGSGRCHSLAVRPGDRGDPEGLEQRVGAERGQGRDQDRRDGHAGDEEQGPPAPAPVERAAGEEDDAHRDPEEPGAVDRRPQPRDGDDGPRHGRPLGRPPPQGHRQREEHQPGQLRPLAPGRGRAEHRDGGGEEGGSRPGQRTASEQHRGPEGEHEDEPHDLDAGHPGRLVDGRHADLGEPLGGDVRAVGEGREGVGTGAEALARAQEVTDAQVQPEVDVGRRAHPQEEADDEAQADRRRPGRGGRSTRPADRSGVGRARASVGHPSSSPHRSVLRTHRRWPIVSEHGAARASAVRPPLVGAFSQRGGSGRAMCAR